MADDLIHIGTRSWWNGNVKTLCGRTIPDGERLLLPSLSSRKRCPACENANGK